MEVIIVWAMQEAEGRNVEHNCHWNWGSCDTFALVAMLIFPSRDCLFTYWLCDMAPHL